MVHTRKGIQKVEEEKVVAKVDDPAPADIFSPATSTAEDAEGQGQKAQPVTPVQAVVYKIL